MLRHIRFGQILLVLLTASIGRTASAQEWKVEYSSYSFGSSFQEADTVVVRLIPLGFYFRNTTAGISGEGFSIVGDTNITIPPNGVGEIRVAYDALHFPRAAAWLTLGGGAAVPLYGGNGPALTDVVVANDVDLGATLFGETSVRRALIRNLSGGSIVINNVTFEKGAVSDFFLRYPPKYPVTVAAGGGITFDVGFKNTYADLRRVTDRMMVELQYEKDSRKFTRKIQVSAGSLDCIELPRTFTIGRPRTNGYNWLGETVIDSLKISNPRSTSITINGIWTEELLGLTVLTPFPLMIDPLSSTWIKFQWNASGALKESYAAQLDVGDCGIEPFTIDALYAIRLFTDENKLLHFDDFVDRYPPPTFTFYNDQATSLTVNSVKFSKDVEARVLRQGSIEFPVTLDPAGLMALDLYFNPSSGVIDDTLLIETDARFEPLRFPIHAILRGFSSVQKAAPSVAVVLSPNPSRNTFAISVTGGRAISIVVTDLLGRPVAGPEPGEVIWDANSITAGSYFIRVAGFDDAGVPFVRTTRVAKE